VKTWATIFWISKDTHWVVVQLDNDEKSVFENEESDVEVGEKLFADWTAYGGSEEVRSKSKSSVFDVRIQGRFFSWQGALKSGKEWAKEA
jgi:hypothetical protein